MLPVYQLFVTLLVDFAIPGLFHIFHDVLWTDLAPLIPMTSPFAHDDFPKEEKVEHVLHKSKNRVEETRMTRSCWLF
jgi:hypothetical protein